MASADLIPRWPLGFLARVEVTQELTVKTTATISIILNLALACALIFALTKLRGPGAVDAPAVVARAAQPPAPETVVSTASSPDEVVMKPFRWGDLESSNGYRGFIANLRAAGCPETSIADIVRGNVDRAFSWQRSRLGLNNSGTGPWSQDSEKRLIASLLGQVAPPEPLFLQNVNWTALGFTADQQETIGQVRKQFQNETANLPEPDSGDSPTAKLWEKAAQDANAQLRGLLGSQAYSVYEQEAYYAWYAPQVKAAAADGTQHIKLETFSP